MRYLYRISVAIAAIGTGICGEASAQVTKLVSKFNDWVLYAHESPQTKICFAAAQPKSSEPARARRDMVLFYVSAWPKDGVKSEISVKIGFVLKKGSDVTVTVGASSFKLFTKDERAFVNDAAEEAKLIDALKKAPSMTVEATSEGGTVTKDTYSLSGT
jgi:hypothetical protein